MNEIILAATKKSNQHRITAELMRFICLLYTAYIICYLLLVSLELLGSWTALLGFTALCFCTSLVYLYSTNGYENYNRHLYLAKEYKCLLRKALQEKCISESELQLCFNSIAENNDIKPTMGGRLLSCVLAHKDK